MYNAPQRAKRLYLRRDPARGRRVPRQRRASCARSRRRAADQPGLAHPRRPPAESRRQPGLVRHAAEPRQRGERRDAGDPVGLHPPLQPRCDARRRCRSSTGWSTTPSPTTATSCGRRSATAHPTDLERAALADLAETLTRPDRRRRCRSDPDRRLRGRQAPPVPRTARLVRLPVSGAARPAGRPALRRLRRAVRHRRDRSR